MANALKELKARRKNVKAQTTRFFNFVKPLKPETITEQTIALLKTKLENIEPSLTIFGETQCKIEAAENVNEKEIEEENIKVETEYYEAVSLARTVIKKYNASLSQSIAVPESTCSVQLPTIKIPQFDGAYDTWFAFHSTFKSLVDSNQALDAVQKFHYLRSALSGEAASVIQALEITKENYEVAWKLLEERYENKKLTIQKHVKALFNTASISRESANDIRTLIDTVQKHLRALEALGEPTQHWDTLMIHLVTSKCDKYTLKEWETHSQKTEKPLLKDIISFLSNKCQILEVINKDVTSSSKNTIAKPRSFIAQTGSCPQCKGKHNLYICEQFSKMKLEERRELVKKLKLCYNCLRSNHRQNDCKAGACRQCDRKHHTLLCNDKNTTVKHNTNEATQESDSSNGNCTIISHVSMSSTNTLKQTLLSTALIKVIDHSGHLHTARILLDPASHCNFMTEAFCKRLKCKTKPVAIPISGIGQLEAQTNHITTVVIKSNYDSYKEQLDFLVLPKITENLPTEDFDDKTWNIPKTIKLADKNYNKSAPVDLLIGAEIFWDLLCVGQIKLGPNLPILHKTQLGWIVGGPLPWRYSKIKPTCNVSLQQVSNQIKQFWEIEDNVSSKPILSKEEQVCVEIFEETTTRADDGKFTIKLPLKENRTTLGSSESTAMKRFYQLERKLAQNESLKKSYTEFMEEYQSLKHMQEVSEFDTSNRDEIKYYIPHHAVIKGTSLTTKTRVVFDASAKTESGVSLNDMCVGPQLQPELFNIVIQFRMHKIGLIADIEKMYRMIWVHPEDRGLQQIFWRNSPEEPLKTYQLCTLTYGTAAASFIATKSLFEIAEREKEKHPMLENIIKKCFYMDDLIFGTETHTEALKFQAELDHVLRAYGFKLRKWCSNNEDVRKALNKNGDEFETIDISKENTIKTLGLIWNPSNDSFQYTVKDDIKGERITKRNILSNIAQIFDPLGLLGPVIMIAKLILQQLWQEGLQWDETPSTALYTQWDQFRNQLLELNNLQINRNVMPVRKPNIIQIHGFCDASEQAYGACLYVRAMNGEEVSCHLLCSKGRVAPLKRISLPRLELCGALLLSQLYKKATSHQDMQFETFFWTDSTIVLSWLQGQPNQWQVFVGNRVSQIQAATKITDWRHVRSNENPADILSRGLYPNQLKHKALWWHGPCWLTEKTTSWPTYRNNATEVPERRNTKLVGMISTIDMTFIEKYSNFVKLRRIIAYCLRFTYNLKHKENKRITNLTVEEINQAEMAIVKFVQNQIYHKEIREVKLYGIVNNSSKLLALKPFLDSQNLLRVGGRLSNAEIPENKKFPIILPSNNHITKLIVQHVHEKLLHAGNQAVLNTLREKYWPINKLSRWQHLQQMYQQFWRRWSLEYLSQLQERTKWKKKGIVNFDIGDLVLIKDENLPPLKWNLGRIIRRHPGKDGEVRVFDVKTKNGEVRRSITKLCRLPIDNESA